MPSYNDVVYIDKGDWNDRKVYDLIAQGLTDSQMYVKIGVSNNSVRKRRLRYLMSMVDQTHNIVLKDGRVIYLTEKQSKQIGMIIIASTRMDKKILVKGQEPAFALNEIETDPEEILRITQTEFDLGKIPDVSTQRVHSMDSK